MARSIEVKPLTLAAVDATEGTTATQVDANFNGGRVLGMVLRRDSITASAAALTVELFRDSTAGNSGKAIFSKVFNASSTPIYPANNGDSVEVECGNLVYFDGANLYYNAWTDTGTFTGRLELTVEPNANVRVRG